MDEKALRSPSSRRAWVEMQTYVDELKELGVALLAEGVGRNPRGDGPLHDAFGVALLAEGVGRNGF